MKRVYVYTNIINRNGMEKGVGMGNGCLTPGKWTIVYINTLSVLYKINVEFIIDIILLNYCSAVETKISILDSLGITFEFKILLLLRVVLHSLI